MKHLLPLMICTLATALAATSAQAVPVKTALGLSLDGSGSIGSSQFNTQIQGYANALGDSSILPADGSVVIYINQFSNSVSTEVTARRLNDENDRTTLVNEVNAIGKRGGGTDIGSGIDDAANALDTFFASFTGDRADDFRAIIDVSTDGQSSSGPSQAQDAVDGTGLNNLAFDQVNCLGVGSRARCDFIPDGSLTFSAADFDEFGDVLRTKLGQELGTGPSVPEPSNLALFAFLIAGGWIGARYRRRSGV